MIKNKLFYYLGLLLCVIGLDRITKILALNLLKDSDFEIINGFFSFSLSINRGISFGLFNSDSFFNFLFLGIIIFLIIIAFMIYTLNEYKNGNGIGAQILILAGALSNLFDRFLYGGVIDFIDFYIKKWHWPIFNVADMAIVFGVFFIIWRSCKNELLGRS